MEATDLLKKVRKIEIKTRGLSKQIFAGEYHSAFKGKGMSFSEVREYQYGDDIRSIDWNVTARFNHPYIKVFEEERELTVMLLIDVSASKEFGSNVQMKEDMMTELAAVLSFSAIHNNDKIGVIFFSDKVEKFISPQKGRSHILRIIRELIDFKPENKETNIAEALKFLTNAIKKRCTAFIISDFVDYAPLDKLKDFEDALTISNKKHDVIALRVYDHRETEIPNIGLIKVKNAETGKHMWVDTSNKQVRENYKKWWLQSTDYLHEVFKKSGVDRVSIRTDEDYVRPLMNLFKRR